MTTKTYTLKQYPKCVCGHPLEFHEKRGDFTPRGRCRTILPRYEMDEGMYIQYIEDECGCPQFLERDERKKERG